MPEYTIELADQICNLVAQGSNLHKISNMEGMPNRLYIYRWFREHPDFFNNYARAREERADFRADKIDNVIQDMRDGIIDSQMARVEIDTLKWQAGKEKPKLYGDSTMIKHADAHGEKLSFNSILQAINGRTSGLPATDAEAGGSSLATE